MYTHLHTCVVGGNVWNKGIYEGFAAYRSKAAKTRVHLQDCYIYATPLYMQHPYICNARKTPVYPKGSSFNEKQTYVEGEKDVGMMEWDRSLCVANVQWGHTRRFLCVANVQWGHTRWANVQWGHTRRFLCFLAPSSSSRSSSFWCAPRAFSKLSLSSRSYIYPPFFSI